MGTKWPVALSMIIMVALSGGKVMADRNSLLAAAGKVDITPSGHVYIAGYDNNRISTGAHDRLMARCLVLEYGEKRIAFVVSDVIGVPRYDGQQIRAKVHSVRPENLFVSATHTHSGPDTLGQWGPDMRTSGVDKTWKSEFLQKVAKLVDETASHLQPAKLRFASTREVPRISKNIRVHEILDKELLVMQAVSEKGDKPIATFVNYACHPEVLRHTHEMTADFPHWLYETVEKGGGGVCLYLNGALGGMVTADFDEDAEPKGVNWKAAEKIGTEMGQRVLTLISESEFEKETPITLQQKVFQVPLENPNFKALIKLHIFPGNLLTNGNIETEVNYISIGPAEFLTLPGEVLPNIGIYLKKKMSGPYRFLLGLTCDELGYILTREDYALDLYSYEASVSIGDKIGERMVDNLLGILPTRSSAR